VANKPKDPDGADDLALLTVDEFLKTAGDRGKKLWRDEKRRNVITDGSKRYALPRVLAGGGIPWRAVEALCDLFGLKPTDFALDQPAED
jgi:hypothetical protein